jgi:NADH-quinone oxidoreductase subunit H
VWILVLAGINVINDWQTRDRVLVIAGVALAVLLVAMLWPTRRPQPEVTLQEQVDARPQGSFPVPPMDLQVPPSPRIRREVAEREPATVGGPPVGGPAEEKEG